MLELDFVLGCVIRLSIVLVIVWLLIWGLRRCNAIWSLWILRFAVVICLLLPVAISVLPSIRLGVLPADTLVSQTPFVERSEVGRQSDTLGNAPLREVDLEPSRKVVNATVATNTEVDQRSDLNQGNTATVAPQELHQPVQSENETPRSFVGPIDLGKTVLGIWLSVYVLIVARLGVEVLSVNRLLAKSRCLSEDEAMTLRRLDCRDDHRRANVMINDALDCPSTGGVFRPRIHLSEVWLNEQSDEQLQAILAHEQAHVDGRDLLWDLVCRLAFALWWFHPLVWRLPRCHRLSCELVSDAVAGESIGNIPLYRRWLAQWTIENQQPVKHASGQIGVRLGIRVSSIFESRIPSLPPRLRQRARYFCRWRQPPDLIQFKQKAQRATSRDGQYLWDAINNCFTISCSVRRSDGRCSEMTHFARVFGDTWLAFAAISMAMLYELVDTSTMLTC